MTHLSPALVLTICLLAAPLAAQVHRANDPPWEGHWLWAPRKADAVPKEVDLYAWLRQRPGGWSTALTHRIVGHAAVAGLPKVYWHLEDEHGRRLYPSQDEGSVLAWSNWGADFGEYDFPASAMRVADRAAMPIALVARSSAVYEEASQRYPDAEIVMAEHLQSLDPAPVRAETSSASALGRANLDLRPHYFRRAFETPGGVDSAELTITAQRGYRLYVNGQRIGQDADWWRGETYEITPLLAGEGPHVIAARVEPDSHHAGLLINMRWTDHAGQEHMLVTDGRWRVHRAEQAGWTSPDFDDSYWDEPALVGFEGVGHRFRLKEPWRNHRRLLTESDQLPEMHVREASLSATFGQQPPQSLLEDAPAEGWAVDALPIAIEIEFDQPLRLRELRLHSGKQADGQAHAPAGVLQTYTLQYRRDGQWVNLVPPVQRDDQADPADAMTAYHAFSPREIQRLRLLIEETYNPDDQAAGYLRGVEILKAYDAMNDE